jgi:hypothetical protein
MNIPESTPDQKTHHPERHRRRSLPPAPEEIVAGVRSVMFDKHAYQTNRERTSQYPPRTETKPVVSPRAQAIIHTLIGEAGTGHHGVIDTKDVTEVVTDVVGNAKHVGEIRRLTREVCGFLFARQIEVQSKPPISIDPAFHFE